jgi:hypothetical protein
MVVISDDNKQRIKATLSFILESYKVLMASLLVVFVPQRCDAEVLHEQNMTVYENTECSLRDNFFDLDRFNLGVLIFNFLTLGSFVALYVIEYIRENWCIEYLDVDINKPNNNLSKEIEKYPELKDKLIVKNSDYYKSLITVIIMSITNFVISAIVVYEYYLDYKTLTVLLTNILLLVDKIASCYSISKTSLMEKLPYSAYMKTPVIFNTIDIDYKKANSEISEESYNEEVKEIENPDDISNIDESENTKNNDYKEDMTENNTEKEKVQKMTSLSISEVNVETQ